MMLEEIRAYVREIVVHSKIEVTFSKFTNSQLSPRQTFIGTCIHSDGSICHIYSNESDLTITLPPQNDSTLIFNITVRKNDSHPLQLKPISQSNREIGSGCNGESNCHIYADGGANSSAGAAAIVVRLLPQTTDQHIVQEQNHSRFYNCTTNNAAELASVIAALRIAKRYKHLRPIVVMDTLLVYNFLVGKSKILAPHLQNLKHTIQELWLETISTTTIAHMYRIHGNFADSVVKQTISTAQHTGDTDLFPDVPKNATRPKPEINTPQTTIHKNLEQIEITSIEQFSSLRRFSVRSIVPTAAQPHWALQVKHHTTKVLNSQTQQEREHNFIQLLLLPNRFLPSNISTSRITRHLQSAQPFATVERTSAANRREHDVDHRLSEAVTRLANDNKMRAANKLLHNIASSPELDFETKLEELKKKIIPTHHEPLHIELEDIPMITIEEVEESIRRLNRQAAPAVDHWSKDHLTAAINFDRSILDDLAIIFTRLLTDRTGPLLTQIIRLGRMVPIAKPDGGIRPIAIASIWSKMLGTIATRRDNKPLSKFQYAASNVKDGASQIIHQLWQTIRHRPRDESESPMVIIKFDITNAFNELDRTIVEKTMLSHERTLRQYFRLMYDGPIPLAVYGPESSNIVTMPNGIRQGDATSSYLFCHAIDSTIVNIAHTFMAWQYVDDLTIVVPRNQVDTAIQFVTDQFQAIGLRINKTKTRMFDPLLESSIPQSRRQQFKVLGIDLNLSQSFFDEFMEKQRIYFDTLDNLQVHPHIKFTLLKFCGSPRIKYLCQCIPSHALIHHASNFDKRVEDSFKKLFGINVKKEVIHDIQGAGIPLYHPNCEAIFFNAKRLSQGHEPVATELVTRLSLAAPSDSDTQDTQAISSIHPTARHNLDHHFLFYKPLRMKPHQFINAMCVRLGTVPQHARAWPIRCDCGTVINNDDDQIQHTFKCDLWTTFTHTRRHNALRDAVINTAIKFGITTTKEPRFYTYESGKSQRPDATFHSEPLTVSVDFAIMSPTHIPGQAIKDEEKRKCKTHDSAVNRLGHSFYPIVCEAYGLMGKQVIHFIDQLCNMITPGQRLQFKREMIYTISNSLAISRANAIVETRLRHSSIVESA